MDFRNSRSCLSILMVLLLVMVSAGTAQAGLLDSVKQIGEDIYDEIPNNLFQPMKLNQDPEIYGPTKINAQLGNQGLSVALDKKGTITVFRWPRPSFYDQVKFHTTDRDKSNWGAHPNAGAFLGLVVETYYGKQVHWLRDWNSTQTYVDDYSDLVKTTYNNNWLDLTVTVNDLVPINENVTAGEAGDPGTVSQNGIEGDALIRRVKVDKGPYSPVQSAKLVAFENFSLAVSKLPMVPIQDWALPTLNTDDASYDNSLDAIIHDKSGNDVSQGFASSRAAAGMAFKENSSSHEVSGDHYIGNSTPRGGYDHLNQDKQLTGRDSFEGQTTGAMKKELDLSDGEDRARVILAAGETEGDVEQAISEARSVSFDYAADQKQAWFRDLVGDAPLPNTSDEDILKLSKRALSTIVLNYDARSSGIVASIATQSPYGEDWPRDGAYFNYVLGRKAGLTDWVERHNKWYDEVQIDHGWDLLRPKGSWAMNYYTDGNIGGIVPWEIDQDAYAIWTMYDHYRNTYDKDYLRDVWPGIRKAANNIRKYEESCAWWKFGNCANLPKKAHEDDHINKTQTIWGAGTAWKAMDVAHEVASTLDKDDWAQKFKNRREELDKAINRELWNNNKEAWGQGDRAGYPEMAWPLEYRYTWNDKMESHLETAWNNVEGSFDQPNSSSWNGNTTADGEPMGLYETKTLISGAKAWSYSSKIDRVEKGLDWVAKRWATDNTNIMGEVWMVKNGEVVSTVSQPHAWEQALFYLGALETYPPCQYYCYY